MNTILREMPRRRSAATCLPTQVVAVIVEAAKQT
jgi:hypothetical protein